MNAVLKDLILPAEQAKQTYLKDNLSISEGTINKDGQFIFEKEITTELRVGNALTEEEFPVKDWQVKLPDTPSGETKRKAYKISLVMSLANQVIDQKEFNNTAQYTNNNGTGHSVLAKVTIPNAGNHLGKDAKQSTIDETVIHWQVPINRAQSKLSEVIVKDTPSTNQVLLLDTVKVYAATVSVEGNITKDETKSLQLDQDFTVKLVTTNFETGEQQMQLAFIGDYQTIDRPYILEYQTEINSPKNPVKISNKASLSANEVDEADNETAIKDYEVKLMASVDGTYAKVLLKKVDSTSEQVLLQGATFELWSTQTQDGKLVKRTKLREGITDGNGELRFSGLAAGRNYLLFETKAPTGYTISEALLNGVTLNLEGEKENAFQVKTFRNELTSAIFKKVASEEQGVASIALPGATFILQDATGKTYVGQNNAPATTADWQALQENEYQTTAYKFISNAAGLVEVNGLVEGEYQFKEIQAPTHYELPADKVIPFVIESNDDGTVTLKEALADVENNREKTTIVVTKKWENENALFKTRPDSVEIQLLRNGKKVTEIPTQLLSADNNWTVSFSNIVKYDNENKAFEYTVTEVNADKRYRPSVAEENPGEMVVTNTLETINISGEKVWKDYHDEPNTDLATRPNAIQVKLMQVINDEKIPVKDKNGKEVLVSTSEKENWAFVFVNLPKMNEAGELINYSVAEVAFTLAEGGQYTPEVTKNQDDTFTITNTYHNDEKVDITGEKEWQDAHNYYGLRPESITLRLWQVEKDASNQYNRENAVEIGEPLVVTGEQTTDINWGYTFVDLDKYDSKGRLYHYFVTEDAVNGYDTSIDEVTGKVTNTLQTTKIPVTKVWVDEHNKFNTRPKAIEVQLFRNDDVTTPIATKTLTEKTADATGHWTDVFTGLPIVNQAGETYTYELKEVPVNGYESSVDATSHTITNTLQTIDIPVEKVWEDTFKSVVDYYQSRPETIEIHLLQNNQFFEQVQLKADEKGHWMHLFEKLPKYDTDGNAYNYQVTEQEVEKYNQTIIGDQEIGYTITNTRKTYAISDYTWVDANQNGVQDVDEVVLPGVIVELYNEQGQRIDTQITDENGRYLFDELTDGTYKIKFTLTKDQMKMYEFTQQNTSSDKPLISDAHHITGWTSEIMLDDSNLFLTKEYTEQEFKATQGVDPTWDAGVVLREKIEVTATKIWLGGPVDKPTIEFQLYRNGEALGEPVKLENGTTTYTWLDLYKTDTEKNTYVYTVQEVGTPSEYHKIEEGLTVTNIRKTYALGDYTWVDLNKNGRQDADEPALPGVKVELYDEQGNKVAETTTDEKGRYLFDELEAGNYQVKFILSSDQAQKYQFTKNQTGDQSSDSNADEKGWTVFIALNEKNTQLTQTYANQVVKASEGIDPTWDAGVILKEQAAVQTKPTPNNQIPQLGEKETAILSVLGLMLIGSTASISLIRRRKLKK